MWRTDPSRTQHPTRCQYGAQKVVFVIVITIGRTKKGGEGRLKVAVGKQVNIPQQVGAEHVARRTVIGPKVGLFKGIEYSSLVDAVV